MKIKKANPHQVDAVVIPSSSPFSIPFCCPECGGKLWAEFEEWEAETGIVTEYGFKLFCSTEEQELLGMVADDDDIEFSHCWWQGDWQPVIDQTHKWLRAHVRIKL